MRKIFFPRGEKKERRNYEEGIALKNKILRGSLTYR